MLSNVYYMPVSFSGKGHVDKIVEKIGENNFPCRDVLSLFKHYGKNENDLFTIHREYYNNLKYCTNLDEARVLYPEFSQVKNASELTTSDFAELHQIKGHSKSDSVSVKDLSLNLIQRYYSYLDDINVDSDKYFGYDSASTKKLMKKLNVPIMDKTYYSFVSKQANKK